MILLVDNRMWQKQLVLQIVFLRTFVQESEGESSGSFIHNGGLSTNGGWEH